MSAEIRSVIEWAKLREGKRRTRPDDRTGSERLQMAVDALSDDAMHELGILILLGTNMKASDEECSEELDLFDRAATARMAMSLEHLADVLVIGMKRRGHAVARSEEAAA